MFGQISQAAVGDVAAALKGNSNFAFVAPKISFDIGNGNYEDSMKKANRLAYWLIINNLLYWFCED